MITDEELILKLKKLRFALANKLIDKFEYDREYIALYNTTTHLGPVPNAHLKSTLRILRAWPVEWQGDTMYDLIRKISAMVKADDHQDWLRNVAILNSIRLESEVKAD